jgi:hypothetical protein
MPDDESLDILKLQPTFNQGLRNIWPKVDFDMPTLHRLAIILRHRTHILPDPEIVHEFPSGRVLEQEGLARTLEWSGALVGRRAWRGGEERNGGERDFLEGVEDLHGNGIGRWRKDDGVGSDGLGHGGGGHDGGSRAVIVRQSGLLASGVINGRIVN